MKALAIVSAPFHLTCLREAVEVLKINRLDIIVHVQAETENARQIHSGLTQFDKRWVNCHVLEATATHNQPLEARIGYYGELLTRFERHSYDLVLFSDFREQWQKDLIDGFRDCRRILLDDGSITLALIHFHLTRGGLFFLPVYGTPERRQYAQQLKRQYGIIPTDGEDIELFTLFHREQVEGRKVIANHLSLLQKTFVRVETSTEVIIGAKIVERGFCDENEYFAMLESINSRCQGKVIYIPHRGESDAQQAQINRRFPDFEIVRPSGSIELWVAQQHIPPAKFHGYVSTAFFIMNQCFPQISLTCYRPSAAVIDNMQGAPVYGSTQYDYRQVTNLLYRKLPSEVEIIQL